jgi:histidyl-tRNA synthetase
MSLKFTVPRGTSDILPRDAYKWNYIEHVFIGVAQAFGYKQIVTPIFEHCEVFERSAGDSTDIVQKEMYKFSDKKGRLFALRPEGTAPVMRSIIENNLHIPGQVTKLFYTGQMFRYDRPQAGRSRQFSQYGCECVGSTHPYYDAESIALFYTFLTALDLKNFIVEINSIGCSICSVVYNDALKIYFEKYLEKLCLDCVNRYEKNPKRLLDCKVETCIEYNKNAPSMLDYLDDSCAEHFTEVQNFLKMLEVPYVINPRIVRGLDYYSQTAYEFINKNLGSQNALGGGGRYDSLIEQMGGRATPGVGFAGGFSRLILSLENENLYMGAEPTPIFYMVNCGDECVSTALSVISFLRKNGLCVEFEIDKKTMKSQMKSADRLGVLYTIIIGPEEIAHKRISVKYMPTGEQQFFHIDKLSELVGMVT